MKFSPEALTGLFFTVAGGIIIWVIKLSFVAMKDSILKQVNERLNDHDSEIKDNKTTIANLKSIADENKARINFLIDSLINKNK